MGPGEQGFSVRDRRIVLIACCITGFISPLVTTMVNVAVPTIGAEFGVSAHDQGWMVMTFFLSSVAFMIPMSRLADMYGKKRMFLLGIVIVLISCILSAFASSYTMLLLGRLLTGVGTACIASTSISMIADVYPKAHRGLPLALNTMFIYIGASVGPVLGGLLTEMFDWRMMFLSIIPFCILGLTMMLFFRPEFKASAGEPFDTKGAILYASGITALMYGILTVPEALSAAFIAAGAVLLLIFFNFETRQRYPVLMVGLFSGRVFRRSSIAAFLNYGSAYAVIYTLSLYLQSIGGMSPGAAGMVILLQPAVQAIVTPFSGRTSDKMDPRILTTVGMIFMCAGTALMITLTAELEMMKIYFVLVFTGLGYAFFSSPNTNLIMGSVDAKNYSESSGVIAVMRQVGMMTSVAIVMCMISLTMGTASVIEPAMYGGFIDAVRLSFSVCLILAVMGTFMTWFSREKKAEEDVPSY